MVQCTFVGSTGCDPASCGRQQKRARFNVNDSTILSISLFLFPNPLPLPSPPPPLLLPLPPPPGARQWPMLPAILTTRKSNAVDHVKLSSIAVAIFRVLPDARNRYRRARHDL